MDSRPVYERLDSIEKQNTASQTQNEEILNLLKNFNSQKQPQVIVNSRPQESEQQLLQRFIKTSKKEHLWFGPNEEFNKSKKLLNIACVVLIIVAIISTILTTKAFKMYSTFTLFENIWTIFVCIILSYSVNAKKRMHDIDLMSHSCSKFVQNEDGTWCDTNQEKKRFRWFRRISYFAVIANIIVIWSSSNGSTAIAVTVFELLFMALTIAVCFLQVNLFCMYGNFVLFTGKNTDNTKTVTIVFDVMGKQLMPIEEFQQKYKPLF